MKTYFLLTFLLILLIGSKTFGSNYYWVGGNGNWSDYATHWATSSGGTVFHVTIPSPSDDVFFDANSFPLAGDTVYMDTTITNCRTMDWSGVTNTPTYFCLNAHLTIYGSFILSPNMNWHVMGGITFLSSQYGNIIQTAGIPMYSNNTETNFMFNQTGGWEFAGPVNMGTGAYSGSVQLNEGSLNTNGYPVTCDYFDVAASADSLLLGNSLITCMEWRLDYVSHLTFYLDAANAIFNCSSGFKGGIGFAYFDITTYGLTETDSCTIHDVFNCGSIYSSAANSFHNFTTPGTSFYYNNGSNNTFNKLVINAATVSMGASLFADTLIFNNPGQQITIEDGETISIGSYLLADGTCDQLTGISSTGNGTFSAPAGTFTFNYVLLQNISATGGATFIANNSVDAGNVTGITVNAPAPRNLYWVGGTGNWNDAAHWTTTSGGAGGSCVPNQFDNVFFDANSFPSANDTMYATGPTLYCNSFDWSTVTNAPTIFGYNMNLKVYGSFILSPNMNWHVHGGITFLSSQYGNIIQTAGVVLASNNTETNFAFNQTGGWEFAGPVNMGTGAYSGSVQLNEGSLNTNGYPVICDYFDVAASADSLLLGNSLITCMEWRLDYVSHLTFYLDAANAIFNCSSGFKGGIGFTYFDITTYGLTETDSCTIHDVFNCGSIYSSAANSFHNFTTPGTSFYYNNGSNNTFNKLVINAATVSMGASLFADTLIFNNPGQQITIEDGETISIGSYLLADGTCDQLTGISSTGNGTFSAPAGTFTFNYVLLQNISATGGATFIANNSVDAGNVTGITVNAPAPRNLYWVGGTGNWNDAAHWTTTSGGAGGSCVPNQFDNVFFDANSFPSANDTMYATGPTLYCNSFDWSTVTNAPTIFGYNMNLKVYGSFILSPNMNWHVHGGITFLSSQYGNIIQTAGVVLASNNTETNFAFNQTGGWEFAGPVNMGTGVYSGSVQLNEGSLNTNGYPVTCDYFDVAASADSLLLGNSLITCMEWRLDYISHLTFYLDAANAIFNCSSGFKGGIGFTYFDITTYGLTETDSCTVHDVNCANIYSSQANSFHNVTSTSTGFFCNGDGNTFNKLVINAPTVSIGATLFADTLIFNNPGQQITIEDGETINVNQLLLIQSDPGFPTSIQTASGSGTISVLNDTVCTDFIYLKNITATGGALFFAGDHSVDLGGNSGWNWIRCAPLISNVWPGDCNYDLITDNFDLLNIGVAYGDTGYVRPGASLAYIAQPCQDWYYQFINAVNVKHADCDGNGIVDGPDSTAISLNYGQTHPARLAHQDESNTVGAELAFDIPPVVVPGSAVSVPINLGTSADPAGNVYGIAFTVDYDPAFIQAGTMSVDYSGSWVENSSNHLHLEKDFPGAGKTDIAFTRIDHIDISGYGMIATLNFVVSPNADGPFSMSFSHVKVISHNEIEVPIQTTSSGTYVNVEENEIEIASVVYPNPMHNQSKIIFSNPDHQTWILSLEDVTGRIAQPEISTTENSLMIERKTLGSGIYFYTIRNKEGRTGRGKL